MQNRFSTESDDLYTDGHCVPENITCKHTDASVQDPILTDIRNELQGNLGMYTQEQHNEQQKSNTILTQKKEMQFLRFFF